MRFAPRQVDEPLVDLTPLIDVVFLLLIFFMVTTTFVRDAGLKVSLPQSSQALQPPARDAIEVVVDAQGRYYLDGRLLRDSAALTLERGLRQVAGDDRQRPILLRADGAASHQSVVVVMDVAGRMGFARLSIATAADGERP